MLLRICPQCQSESSCVAWWKSQGAAGAAIKIRTSVAGRKGSEPAWQETYTQLAPLQGVHLPSFTSFHQPARQDGPWVMRTFGYKGMPALAPALVPTQGSFYPPCPPPSCCCSSKASSPSLHQSQMSEFDWQLRCEMAVESSGEPAAQVRPIQRRQQLSTAALSPALHPPNPIHRLPIPRKHTCLAQCSILQSTHVPVTGSAPHCSSFASLNIAQISQESGFSGAQVVQWGSVLQGGI